MSLKTIELEGNTFVDISNIESTPCKLEFIESNKQLFDDNCGFILEKNVETNKFILDNYNKQAYLFYGYVIVDRLNEPKVRSRVVYFLRCMIGQYSHNNKIVGGEGSTSITINNNTCQQPDGILFRFRQLPLIQNENVLLVFEVNYKSLPPPQAMQKVIRYFTVNSINVGILLLISDRNPQTGDYKLVAAIYERNISIFHPSSIISFGSQALSANDIASYNALSNNPPITGRLYNNMHINNNANNPVFIITINPQSLYFNSPIPAGVAPLVINLFNLKQYIDTIPNFSEHW